MYTPVKVDHLSKQQVSRLLNGHSVRVKHHPQGRHTVHLSKEQTKKMARAHAKGGAVNLSFDPYQIQHHQYLRDEAKGGALSLKKVGREIKKAFTSKLGKEIQHQLLNKAVDFGKSSGYVPPSIATSLGHAGHRAIQAEGLGQMLHSAKKHLAGVAKRGAPLLSKFMKEEAHKLRGPAEHLVEKSLVPYFGEPAAHDIAVYGATKGAHMLENQISNITGHGMRRRGPGRPRKHPKTLSIKLKKPRLKRGGAVGALFPPQHAGGALYPAGYYM